MKPRIYLPLLAAVGLILCQACTSPSAAAPPAAPSVNQGGLQPLADDAWDYAKARHLLFHAGFGGPPEEVEKLHALGLRKAVDFLVDYRCQPDVKITLGPSGVQTLDPAALAKLSPEERAKLAQQNRNRDAQYMQEVRHWWIKRMIQSPRPLEEKLTLFWHGHFANEWRTVRNAQAMALQNQLFREHAAGNFGKLLHAIIRDAAMLRYLDNNTNVKGKANENLAREIMELFAMGESQGYTEKDVIEGARALTGYTFDPRTLQPRFNANNHDTTDKTIFGKTGKWNGEQFVDLILQQPATSRFIAGKLFTYFVRENPSEELLAQLAGILKNNDYELAPLLKTIFLSREFYKEQATGTQVKSPVQFVIGTVRVLQIKDPDPEGLARAMRAMNQDLFEPPNVKGWDGGQTWINSVTLFARHNFISLLVARGLEAGPIKPEKAPLKPNKSPQGLPTGPVAQVDLVEALQGKKLDTPAAVVDHCARALLASPLPEHKRKELVGFLGQLPPSSQWADQKKDVNRKIGALLVLLMCLPEYQLT